MEHFCDCGRKAAYILSVRKPDGELIEEVKLCEKCGLHEGSVEALDTLGIRMDKSLIR